MKLTRVSWLVLAVWLGCAGTPNGEGPSTPGAGGQGNASGGRGGATPAAGGARTGGVSGAPVDAASGADVPPTGGTPGAPPPPSPPTTRPLRLGGVATWRGNATAAYTIIHDDVCDGSAEGAIKHAGPMLTARGLRGGFGVIVNRCVRNDRWAAVKALADQGHEVFNHSWDHPCMGVTTDEVNRCSPSAMRSSNLMQEIDDSTRVLRQQGHASQFFIFPYDVCNSAALERLAATDYLGARCGDRRTHLNEASFADPFRLQFDVWGPAYSTYGQMVPCMGVKEYATAPAATSMACRIAVLNRLVDDVIAKKGWALREMHGFDGDPGPFEPVSQPDYTAHLDHLQAKVKEGALWVDGPSVIIKYRFARERCAPPTLAGNKLTFPAPSAMCTRHATALSYLINTTDNSDPATLTVTQGGRRLGTRKLGPGSFALDADPTAGDAVIGE